MKTWLDKVIAILLVFVVFVSNFNFINANNIEEKGTKENISYEDSWETFDNPERGYYTEYNYNFSLENNSLNTSGLNGNLVHLNLGLEAFSGKANGTEDLSLTDDMLSTLAAILKTVKNNGGSSIIRFAYDNFTNKANMEPDIEKVIEHITAISKVINENKAGVSYIEAGFIGPKGEMTDSEICTSENITRVIDTLKSNVSSDIAIGKRENSGWTYTKGNSSFTGRENVNDITELTSGKVMYLSSSAKGNFPGIYNSDDASYVDATNETYVANHLGYRFVVKEAIITDTMQNTNLDINLQIENVGFTNLVNKKKVSIILEKEGDTYEIAINDVNPTNWYAGNTNDVNISVKLPEDILTGEYNVYLKVSKYGKSNNYQSIRFANIDMWQENLNANYIGNVVITENIVSPTPDDTDKTEPTNPDTPNIPDVPDTPNVPDNNPTNPSQDITPSIPDAIPDKNTGEEQNKNEEDNNNKENNSNKNNNSLTNKEENNSQNSNIKPAKNPTNNKETNKNNVNKTPVSEIPNVNNNVNQDDNVNNNLPENSEEINDSVNSNPVYEEDDESREATLTVTGGKDVTLETEEDDEDYLLIYVLVLFIIFSILLVMVALKKDFANKKA